MPFTVSIEWSSRSRALQSRLAQKIPGVSFWLLPQQPPAAFGFIEPRDVGSWPTAKMTRLVVNTNMATQSVTVTIPDSISHIRLDFALIATSKGQTSTILSLRQLFLATSTRIPEPRRRRARIVRTVRARQAINPRTLTYVAEGRASW